MGVEGAEKGVGATETYSGNSDSPIMKEAPDPNRTETPRIGGGGEFPTVGCLFGAGFPKFGLLAKTMVPNGWTSG